MKAKVDENKFRAVKILLEGGATWEEAAKFMNLSVATIGRIAQSESLQEYKSLTALRNMQYRESAKKKQTETKKEEPKTEPVKVVHEQHVTVQASHFMLEEQKKTNELLTIISKKLAFIVDELCGVKVDNQNG